MIDDGGWQGRAIYDLQFAPNRCGGQSLTGYLLDFNKRQRRERSTNLVPGAEIYDVRFTIYDLKGLRAGRASYTSPQIFPFSPTIAVTGSSGTFTGVGQKDRKLEISIWVAIIGSSPKTLHRI